MRRVAAVTGARSDYGILRPVLRAIHDSPVLALEVWVTGMHLSPEFGYTVSDIEHDGFPIAERIPSLLSSDEPAAVGSAIGLGVLGFTQSLSRRRPDVLLLLGDRFETFAAAIAALPLRIPVAHVHGGEVSFGAIDDAMRHAITKMSHLHFVSTEAYARRVRQLGEEPWRVTVCGAPALDTLSDTPLMSSAELEARFGVCLDRPVLLVTFHAATLDPEPASAQADELVRALHQSALPAIVTAPNADPGGREIARRLRRYVAEHDDAWWLENVSTPAWYSLMQHAAAMVGNSSSGILEAPTFRLPVVNVGARQDGRLRAPNVLDVAPKSHAIVEGIRYATSPQFRERLRDMQSPYQHGDASRIIVERLSTAPLDCVKRFHDLSAAEVPPAVTAAASRS